MKKHKTIKCILGFLSAAALALPSYGCAYERSRRSMEQASSSPTNRTVDISSADPAESSTIKRAGDVFYNHTILDLEAPYVKSSQEDVRINRTILDTQFLDNVLLVHETSRFESAADPEADPEREGASVEPGVIREISASQYSREYYSIYDLDGNLQGVIFIDSAPQGQGNSYFQNNADGNIIRLYVSYDTENGDNYLSYQIYDRSGSLLEDKPNHYLLQDGEYDLTGALFTQDGKLLVTTYTAVHQFRADGTPETAFYFDTVSSGQCIGLSKEGNSYYIETLYYDDDGEMKSALFEFNALTSDSCGVETNADNLFKMKVFQSSSGLYAMTKNVLGKLSLKDGEFSQMIDWNQTDIDRALLINGDVKVLRDGKLSQPIKVLQRLNNIAPAAIEEENTEKSSGTDKTNDYGDTSAELLVCSTVKTDDGQSTVLIHIFEADSNPHADQTEIWLGGVDFSDGDVSSAIARFNSDHTHDIWIKVTDYSNYTVNAWSSGAEREKAVETLYSQMLSGSGPDIICGLSDYGSFDRNRVLTDLNPYIDSIHGIDRSKYFNNLFTAFEMDGKLYQIPVTFMANGLLWDPAMFEEYADDYTISSLAQAASENDDDSFFMISGFTTDPFRTITNNLLINNVNYSTGELDMTQDDIAQILMILERVADSPYNFPESETYDFSESKYALSSTMVFDDNVVMPYTVNSLWKYLLPSRGAYDLTGYPSSNGSSYIARADISFGIASYSNNKELAWEFIRFMLSDTEQSRLCTWTSDIYGENSSGIPVSSGILKRFLTKKIGEDPTASYDFEGYSNSEGVPYNWTASDIDSFMSFIGSISTRFSKDDTIDELISDELRQMIEDGKSPFEAAFDLAGRIRSSI